MVVQSNCVKKTDNFKFKQLFIMAVKNWTVFPNEITPDNFFVSLTVKLSMVTADSVFTRQSYICIDLVALHGNQMQRYP